VAEGYLKQLDLRQRQVALSVKILDLNFSNVQDISNSFAIRWGNNFIVNDNGSLAANFGDFLPASKDRFSAALSTFPAAPNPGTNYDKNNFYDFLQAQVVSGNAKLISSPTLILQENPSELRGDGSQATIIRTGGESLGEYSIDAPIGRKRANEGVVRVGTNVPTKVSAVQNSQTGTTSCDISELSTAGLVLGARVEKIDDNGFVTFTLSPSVSAVTDIIPSGGDCPPISILAVRRLDTGAVRVRDRQTLVLTGVISDSDKAAVTKWPILGDIPIIGQFFRSSSNEREKRELVILVTPQIINDVEGGVYGYGYQPSTPQAREFMGSAPY
jgi:type IV pilus assembly protein PilQ